MFLKRALDFKRDEVMDILNDFNIVSLPTKDNSALIINAAWLTLVNNPLFFPTNIRIGLGEFWDEVTPDEVRSLYGRSNSQETVK